MWSATWVLYLDLNYLFYVLMIYVMYQGYLIVFFFSDDTNLFCSDNDINDLCGSINL